MGAAATGWKFPVAGQKTGAMRAPGAWIPLSDTGVSPTGASPDILGTFKPHRLAGRIACRAPIPVDADYDYDI